MDYLQNTSSATSEASVITQLLPMAAPLQPLSRPTNVSQLSTHVIDSASSEHQIRSSSAPADCMLTSSYSGAASFLGTFASTPSFQASLQQSQQLEYSTIAGGRPRHHTTTNVLSLDPMDSSQESPRFLGNE